MLYLYTFVLPSNHILDHRFFFMTQTTPLLFAIKRYALHDGPNIRTTVFFKGCPLSCFWCHNPEGISPNREVILIQDKCIGCRECLHACPESALSFNNGAIYREYSKCTTCLECVEICPALAHEAIGYQSTISEVIAEIEKDRLFYDQSGGGVTFSGGEPLMQPEPLLELLKECGKRGIHRAVDTTGFAPTSTLLEIANHVELFLFDIKIIDNALHKQFTGVENTLILKNLERLSEHGAKIQIRIPLLAGINDSDHNMLLTAGFISKLHGIEGVDILPYHHLASNKYQKLGEKYKGEPHHTPDTQSLSRVTHIFEECGLLVRIGA